MRCDQGRRSPRQTLTRVWKERYSEPLPSNLSAVIVSPAKFHDLIVCAGRAADTAIATPVNHTPSDAVSMISWYNIQDDQSAQLIVIVRRPTRSDGYTLEEALADPLDELHHELVTGQPSSPLVIETAGEKAVYQPHDRTTLDRQCNSTNPIAWR